MDVQLYIRIRGRVLGPYDEEKLQSLARHGQLSRMHEVSTDGVSWMRATSFPNLFLGDEAETSAASVPEPLAESPEELGFAAEPVKAPSRSTPATDTPSTRAIGLGASDRWFYRQNGRQMGPVDMAVLQQMVTFEQIKPDDMVWSEGRPNWLPVSQVPGIVMRESGRLADDRGERVPLPLPVCTAATSSRSWILLVAVTSFVCAGLTAIGGVAAVVTGTDNHFTPLVAAGFFGLIYAGIIAVYGMLLTRYAARLAPLLRGRAAPALEMALDALRAVWIYMGIGMIVFLTFAVIEILWIIASGSTLPK